MPKPLPKLNWLPDFDGRQRLYRPLNKGRQEIRVVEVLYAVFSERFPYGAEIPIATMHFLITGGRPWTWRP
jgi:hypothetical protein